MTEKTMSDAEKRVPELEDRIEELVAKLAEVADVLGKLARWTSWAVEGDYEDDELEELRDAYTTLKQIGESHE